MNTTTTAFDCAYSMHCSSDCSCRANSTQHGLATTATENDAERAHELRCLKQKNGEQAWNTTIIGLTALGVVYMVCNTALALFSR